jgi:tetratricopeptide (TPR) repeat protein
MRTRALAIAVGFWTALAAVAPGAARADDPEPPPEDTAPGDMKPDPKEAKRWMTAGDTLIKRGDQLARRGKTTDAQSQYERALVSYQKAFELTNNPQVYFAIAAAEEKLGKQVDALLHYRKVVLHVSGNLQLVEAATQRLAALSQDVGLLIARVDPEGAQLELDGAVIGTAPLAEPAVLQPGEYTLRISADGHQPLEVRLRIDAGSESERTFKLEPIPVVFDAPKEAPRPVKKKVIPSPSTLPLWLGGVLAVGFTGVATTTGILAVGEHDTFRDPNVDEPTRDAARDRGKKLSLATDLCALGAVAATGFTLYWYFGVYRPARRAHRRNAAETEPKIAVVPWVEPSIGGAALAVTY